MISKSALLFGIAILPLVAQTSQRPEVIEAKVRESGRFAVCDLNRDGWDDIWQALFPDIDVTQPDLDPDRDGKTNYEEMLDFGDPYARRPARVLTREEEMEARKAAAQARRESDQAKVSRFHQLLKSRKVLVDGRGVREPEPPAIETGEESSRRGDDGWGEMMLCGGGGGALSTPSIIGLERLSNGQCLLAWEANPARICHVEWAEDLVVWKGASGQLPTVGGVGTWGEVAVGPARFYRVVEDEFSTTTPSDPGGGDGTNTFGGSLSINSSGTLATVQPNLPGGIDPSSIKLHINGEEYGLFERYGSEYRCTINRERFPLGIQTAYALINASFETTPGPENPAPLSPGLLRTQEVAFDNPGDNAGVVAFRASETEINSGLPGSPDTTVITLDIHQHADPGGGISEVEYVVRIRDDGGYPVREWTGTADAATTNTLSFVWDGTGDGGATLPAGTYSASAIVLDGGDFTSNEPILIRTGEMQLKALALFEKLKAQDASNWGEDEIEEYLPDWAELLSTSAWGPWPALESGPNAICTNLKKILGGHQTKWKVTSWGPADPNNDAEPWTTGASRPANEFLTGNPFNSYDIGFLIGHGVASEGGAYEDSNGAQKVMPPQHYFPMVAVPQTGETVWIKSGQMAEKFGAAGKLKWMFVVTCNYLRVGAHNQFNQDDIYGPMKQQETLPFGPGLHVLCGYTTSVNVNDLLAIRLSEALLGNVPDEQKVVDAWNYAWEKSQKDLGHLDYNARSVYWPECRNDTIAGVAGENVAVLQAHATQTDLEEADSRFP